MSRSLMKSTGVVGAATLVSRLLGFLRDMLQALFSQQCTFSQFWTWQFIKE